MEQPVQKAADDGAHGQFIPRQARLWCLAAVAGGHLAVSDPFVRMGVRPLFMLMGKPAKEEKEDL